MRKSQQQQSRRRSTTISRKAAKNRMLRRWWRETIVRPLQQSRQNSRLNRSRRRQEILSRPWVKMPGKTWTRPRRHRMWLKGHPPRMVTETKADKILRQDLQAMKERMLEQIHQASQRRKQTLERMAEQQATTPLQALAAEIQKHRDMTGESLPLLVMEPTPATEQVPFPTLLDLSTPQPATRDMMSELRLEIRQMMPELPPPEISEGTLLLHQRRLAAEMQKRLDRMTMQALLGHSRPSHSPLETPAALEPPTLELKAEHPQVRTDPQEAMRDMVAFGTGAWIQPPPKT